MWCSCGAAVVQALSTRHRCVAAGSVMSVLARHVRQYSSPANSAAEQAASLQQTLDQAISSSVSCATGFAAQPLEPLSQLMNPVVFSSSFWELMHSATGLPWWASIPVTTLALRTAFLPFTLAAKSAALNFVLAQKASETASRLLQKMKQEELTHQQIQQLAAAADGQLQPSTANSIQQLRKPSWFKLSRMYYRYFRQHHKTTHLGWFVFNTAAQLNIFLWLSMALRQMSASQWPGLTTEGLGYIIDLTQPSVVWGTWVCPYGVAGIGLPFALLVLYLKTVQQSPLAKRSERWRLFLDAGSLPYFMLSCVVPQATLLYWGANGTFYYGLNWLQQSKYAKHLGLPSAMLPLPTSRKEEKERVEMEAAEAQELICGAQDDGFVRYLAAYYLSKGMHPQALKCLQRLTVLAPGDAVCYSSIGKTAAELEQWALAAAAYERAAELYAAATGLAGQQDRQLHLQLAGKHWLNAAAEAKQLQKTATSQQQESKDTRRAAAAASISSTDSRAAAPNSCSSATSSSSSHSSSNSSSSSSMDIFGANAVVQACKQEDYLLSALSVLEPAVDLAKQQEELGNTADAWYLLAMAQTASGLRDDALSSGQVYWDKACKIADSDPTAKSSAAAKLLPVLVNLCKRYDPQQDVEQLLQAAEFAVKVSECGWDRQSQEQLRDELGRAASAAAQHGNFAASNQLKELQSALQAVVAQQSKFRRA